VREPDQTLTLAIETSNPSAQNASALEAGERGPGVALGLVDPGGTRLLAFEPLGAPQPNEDPLARLIDSCAKRAGVTPREVKRVAVSMGPGGFTSVRVAVTTAKLIAEATGAQCVGVPTAMVGAWEVVQRARESHAILAGDVGIALASKADYVWVQVYGPTLNAWGDGLVVDAPGFAALARAGMRTLAHDAFLPASIADAARASGVALVPLHLSAAGVLALSASPTPTDPSALLPIYPREPEAVTKWRALGRHEGPGTRR
jgi:tRNA threonylcarbamoyladenosine biosynthesis protein TsaB